MTEEFIKYYNNAISEYQQNNMKLAEYNFTQCIKINPEFNGSYCNRGLVYYNLNEFEKAIIDFEKAINLDPQAPESYFNLGLCYKEIGNYIKAIEQFELAKSFGISDNMDIHINETTEMMNSPLIFSSTMLNSIATDNNDPQVAYNLAKLFLERKEFVTAIDKFNRVISLNSKFIEAYFDKAECYIELKEYEKAISTYTQVAKLEYEHKDRIFNSIGHIYYILKQYQLSIDYYNKSIDFNPYNSESYRLRAEPKYSLQLDDEMIFDLTRSIELDPNNLQSYFSRGYILAQLGKNQAANIDYNLLLEKLPNNSTVLLNAGMVKHNLGFKQEGMKLIKQSEKLGNGEATELIRLINNDNSTQ